MFIEKICCNCRYYEGVHGYAGCAPCEKNKKMVLWDDSCEYIWLIPQRLQFENNEIDYYTIAKQAYCTEGDQWDCRDCKLIDYFEKSNHDPAKCREHLIVGLVKQYEKLLEEKNE